MTTYPKDTLSVAEAAKRVGISEQTLRKWIKAGAFPGRKLDQVLVITRFEYEQWLRNEWKPLADEKDVA